MNIRKNAAIIVADADKKILIGKRCDISSAWQLPQGGIDDGESAVEAAYRELFEKTGYQQEDISLVAHSAEITYLLPEEIRKKARFDGQSQIYFLFHLKNRTKRPVPNPEFSDFEWVLPEEAVRRAVDFKKEAYIEAFRQLLGLEM